MTKHVINLLYWKPYSSIIASMTSDISLKVSKIMIKGSPQNKEKMINEGLLEYLEIVWCGSPCTEIKYLRQLYYQ